MKSKLSLIDLIDADTLIPIEKAFCEVSGMAAHISDMQGMPLTPTCNPPALCRLIKTSPLGRARCISCYQQGASMAKERDSIVYYQCHAGLVNFAAPVKIQDEVLGCFIGGQALNSLVDEQKALQTAQEISIIPSEYLAALRALPVITKEQLRKAADFLYSLTNIISKIGYNRTKILESNKELERATQSKSDFLANMSHEIRTPMNAINGMSEMAMREPLPPAATEYINQIKSAGQTLLTILNDILDFSKIETGAVEIHPVEYMPMSLVNDITNTISTRIGDKDIEFTVNMNPSLPDTLLGDHVRLNQIILNITNNAVKFTQCGEIRLSINFEMLSADELMLQISVEDTGTGIRKSDIDKLFNAFQRIDTTRTRNIEGSGLGLTITKQLLTHMGGNIRVESEFGKGSCFSFAVPQKIICSDTSVTIKEPQAVCAAGLINNRFIAQQLLLDLKRLGIPYMPVASEEELMDLARRSVNYLFIEHAMYSKQAENFVRSHPEITCVLMIDFHTILKTDIPHLLIIKKPLYSAVLANIFNGELYTEAAAEEEPLFDYIAPAAQVLIVDDNAVNLTVAEGLLEPLEMQIDTAASAQDAIDKVSRSAYDLILMDHMMPEVDGVEATHIIRRFYPSYIDTPIIALSANAVHGAKDMFLEEGMNDFVPKPIELPVILSALRQWLPQEKIQSVEPSRGAPSKKFQPPAAIQIEGLDTQAALKLLGTEKLFWEVLKDYYRVIQKKAALIQELEQTENWRLYTVEVHALKSASRQIGAVELAELAARMEQAGNEGDGSLIHESTPSLIEQYLAYDGILAQYFKEEDSGSDEEKPLISTENLWEFFELLRTAFDELDMDQMEEIIEAMKQFRYADDQKELFSQLCGAVEELDTDASEDILKMWETRL